MNYFNFKFFNIRHADAIKKKCKNKVNRKGMEERKRW